MTLFLKASLLILFFLVQTWFGWIFSRRVLKEHQLYILIPFSLVIGVSIYTFLLNLVSYVIPITFSFYLILSMLALSGILIYIFMPIKERIRLGLSQKATWTIALTLVFISVTGFFADIGLITHDERIHRAFISTVAQGNFPVKVPFAPEFIASYHYGIYLIPAAVHKITEFQIYWVIDVVNLFFTVSSFLVLFALTKRFIGSSLTGYLASLFFFYGGGLLWVKFFTHLHSVPIPSTPFLYISSSSLWGNIVALFTRLAYLPSASEFFYRIETGDGFIAFRNHLPSLFGFPIFFCLLFLLLENQEKEMKGRSITIVILLGTLALVEETKAAILVVGLALYWIWYKFFCPRVERKIVRNNIITVFVSILVMLFQGGVITQLFFSNPTMRHIPDSYVSPSFFSLRKELGIPYWPGFMAIGSPGWLSFYVQFFGIFLLTSPMAIFYVFSKRIKVGVFLGIIAILAFIIPHVISIKGEAGLIRFLDLAICLFAITLAIALGGLIEANIHKSFRLIAWVSTISILLLSSISPLLNTLRYMESKPQYYGTSQLDKEMGMWIQKNLPPQKRVLAEEFFLIPELSGLFVPVYIYGQHVVPRKEYQDAIKFLDIEALKNLDIDYIYLTKKMFDNLSQKGKERLKDIQYFTEIFTVSAHQQKVDWRKLYQFVDKTE